MVLIDLPHNTWPIRLYENSVLVIFRTVEGYLSSFGKPPRQTLGIIAHLFWPHFTKLKQSARLAGDALPRPLSICWDTLNTIPLDSFICPVVWRTENRFLIWILTNDLKKSVSLFVYKYKFRSTVKSEISQGGWQKRIQITQLRKSEPTPFPGLCRVPAEGSCRYGQGPTGPGTKSTNRLTLSLPLTMKDIESCSSGRFLASLLLFDPRNAFPATIDFRRTAWVWRPCCVLLRPPTGQYLPTLLCRC